MTTTTFNFNSPSTWNCGPLRIFSHFDSGNVLKAEFVGGGGDGNGGGSYQPENHDYEINVWTRPDCYGTLFENGNRTWFHFGVGGGRPGAILKINVINLNKQTKLFLQGMQPVWRIIPDKPKWERVLDRVVINENKQVQENGCSITFRLNLPEDNKPSTLFVAFTYPFGYLDLCDFLTILDSEFLKNNKPTLITKSNKSSRKELWLHPSLENDVYYHRECLCYSLEGRRVDLITVSSVFGISEKREERLVNLFPKEDEQRPFKFPGKKVVFLSARVHPGETPSSFVLNGFLKFIMNKTDPRAVILRRLFVFKFIPILNPDGVFHGHYRTDPRGVNLNRVYLNPSQKLHPSIYAARKLLIYYHSGVDQPDENESNEEPIENVTKSMDSLTSCGEDSEISISTPIHIEPVTKMESEMSLFSEDACFDTISPQPCSSKKPYTFVLSDINSLCAGCVPADDVDDTACFPSSSSGEQVKETQSLNNSLDSAFHQCAFEACDEDSVLYQNLKASESLCHMEVDPPSEAQGQLEQVPKLDSKKEKRTTRSASPRRRKRGSFKDNKKSAKQTRSPVKTRGLTRRMSEDKVQEQGIFSCLKQCPSSNKSQKCDNATLSYKSTSTARYYDSSSGLFLYFDMHGHTTKRGIFMYGNHFPDVNTQAECLLVPRIMALNSQHFDFAACNFTERLMSVKDRKDGLSREGCGRVACLKLTGLVRSYTVECNYNTGRIVNPMVSRPSNSGFADPSPCSINQPPPYTIELFEEVGRALAETVLDMSGQNPYSRLTHTEFKNVEGVKRSLVNRLKLSPEFKLSLEAHNVKQKCPNYVGNSNSMINNPVLSPSQCQGQGSKPNRKLKPKVLTPAHSGPLGPKNRENFRNSENAKPSGSQSKKLPSRKSSATDQEIPGSSSSLNLPKSKLSKVLKKTKNKKDKDMNMNLSLSRPSSSSANNTKMRVKVKKANKSSTLPS